MYFAFCNMLLLFRTRSNCTIISLSHILSQVKITRSACDMWQVWHVEHVKPPTCISPKHNWQTEFLTLPSLESRRSRCWSPVSAIMMEKWKWEIATKHFFSLSAAWPSKICDEMHWHCLIYIFWKIFSFMISQMSCNALTGPPPTSHNY